MGDEMSQVMEKLIKAVSWSGASGVRLTGTAKRFLSNSQGAVILIIGLAIIPLAIALGLMIDSTRSYTAYNRLQGAVDAAALAGANSMENEEESIEEAATRFFASNYADDYLGGDLANFSAVFDEASGAIVVSAEVLLPTTFMRVAGKNDVVIEATASAMTQTSGLELALVVDVTGSMDDTVGGVKKIDSLKTAATALLAILYGENDTVEDLFVSLVPYSSAVNIGTDRSSFVKNLDESAFAPETWQGCVEARDGGDDQTDMLPTASATKFDPYNFKSYIDVFGTDFGDSANMFCPSQPITPLEPSRQAIEDEIDALTASGATLTNIGMVWGWRSLSPTWRGNWGTGIPADRPLDYDADDNIKAIVFMTDGQASIFDYTAYGLLSEERLGTSDVTLANQEIDDRLLAVCNSMKAEGIQIFTIMFDLDSPVVEALYRDCATSAEHFFELADRRRPRSCFQKNRKAAHQSSLEPLTHHRQARIGELCDPFN